MSCGVAGWTESKLLDWIDRVGGGRAGSVYKAREYQILSRWAELEIWRFGGDQRGGIIRHPADPQYCSVNPGPGIQMRCSVK